MEIKKVIGTGLAELKGKNTPAMQPSNMANSITFTRYTADAVRHSIGVMATKSKQNIE
jgi:hypothetical protein